MKFFYRRANELHYSTLIWHLETHDIISVRASVPMHFPSKAISDFRIKVAQVRVLMIFWRVFVF
jgi:asparagine synthetase B (glutamine-hydrolysing)